MGLVKEVYDYVKSQFVEEVKQAGKKNEDTLMTAAKWTAGTLAAYAIYRLISYHEDANRGPSIEEASDYSLDRGWEKKHNKQNRKAVNKPQTTTATTVVA